MTQQALLSEEHAEELRRLVKRFLENPDPDNPATAETTWECKVKSNGDEVIIECSIKGTF